MLQLICATPKKGVVRVRMVAIESDWWNTVTLNHKNFIPQKFSVQMVRKNWQDMFLQAKTMYILSCHGQCPDIILSPGKFGAIQ